MSYGEMLADIPGPVEILLDLKPLLRDMKRELMLQRLPHNIPAVSKALFELVIGGLFAQPTLEELKCSGYSDFVDYPESVLEAAEFSTGNRVQYDSYDCVSFALVTLIAEFIFKEFNDLGILDEFGIINYRFQEWVTSDTILVVKYVEVF